MSEFPPTKGVKYRIQNVDYETFLERRGKDSILLRPKKDIPDQEWLFNPSSKSYEICDPSDDDLVLAQAGDKVIFQSKASAPRPIALWKFTKSLYIENTNSVSQYLHATSSTTPKCGNIGDPSGRQDCQWNILQVSPASLPEADDKNPMYRIRTLIGKAIHCAGDKVHVKADQKGLDRAWLIRDKGNGKCTIFNVQDKKFLSTTNVNNNWEVCLDENAEDWIIKSNIDFTYLIYTKKKRSQIERSYSLALRDSTVILEELRNTHNQIWVIEPTHKTLENGSTATSTVEPKDGSYKLRNLGGKGYISFKGNSDPPDVELSSTSLTFYIRHMGNKKFTLSFTGSNTRYLAIDKNKLVATDTPFTWVIDKEGSRQHFYICDPANQSQVLADTLAIVTIDRNDAYERKNLWSFDP